MKDVTTAATLPAHDAAMTDLATVARWTGGALRGADAAFARVTTDSRDVRAGDLFVALAGERFDGHAFVAGALAAGAVGAIVAAEHAVALPGNLVVVADTLSALQTLAQHWRAQFVALVIVVTGSNGKIDGRRDDGGHPARVPARRCSRRPATSTTRSGCR